MGNEADSNKFTWFIKNFSSLGSEKVYSDEFVIGGCKWRLMAFPKGGNISNHLALYLAVADTKYLQFGGRRHTKFSCTTVNQFSEKLSVAKEMDHWFDLSGPDWGYIRMINLDRLKSKDGGFMVNGEVKIVAEVHVLEVIGELDVREETQPLKKMKLNVTSDLPKETPAGWVDINGFQVLPSQVELVKRIFEKHPDIALECLSAYPKGTKTPGYLSLFLVVADSTTLPSVWRRHTKCSLTVVNQLSDKLSLVKGEQLLWFDQRAVSIGFPALVPLTELHATNSGFLVNDELKIVVEVEVLDVIGKLDVPEAETQPQKKRRIEQNIDLNAYHVRPSQLQAKFVSRVFKTYPEIALEIRAKNEPLKTSCLYVFLGLIATLCKSVDKLSNDNLVEAENSINYLKYSSIKVDSLEEKLEEVKEKNKQEQIGVARTRKLEETLKMFEQKCLEVKAMVEKEKGNVLAARAPSLTLDEVV